MAEPEPQPAGLSRALPLAATLAACAAQLHGWRGRWIPHDEGTLLGSAQRVLAGQLPHRDYDEVYSGGLALYQATWLRLTGQRLDLLRLSVVLPALLLFVPCLYLLARRFARPWPAAAISAVAFAWGLPNYPAAMPSWFNLMAAAGAGVLLLRAEGAQRPGPWRAAAGAAIGLSIAVKISGLYLLAAALLFLALGEQRAARSKAEGEASARLLPLAMGGWLALAALLTELLGATSRPAPLAHFLVPPLAAALLWPLGERGAQGSFGARLKELMGRLAPLAAGLLLALLPWIGSYAAAGALDDLLHGLFVLPAQRLEHASFAPPAVGQLLWGLPWALLLLAGERVPQRLRPLLFLPWLVPALLGSDLEVYRAAWASAQSLVVLLPLAAATALLRWDRDRQVGALLALAVALCSLVRFPFSTPLYVPYVAPLAVLLAAWLGRGLGRAAGTLALGGAGLFAVLWLHTGTLSDLGWGYHRQAGLVELNTPRGGLRVHASEAAELEQLLALLETAPEGPLLAGPDAPEVYALAGRLDPTRGPFEFFELAGGDPTQRWLERVERLQPTAVVLHLRPSFSPAPTQALLERLQGRYTRWTPVGRFLVGLP